MNDYLPPQIELPSAAYEFNGSVRLFRRFSTVPGRGHFHCELPNAADPSVNQILYVNILNFGVRFDTPHVTFSPSTGSTGTTAGQRDYSLTCSSTLNSVSDLDPDRLPVNVPAPRFVWSFGPSGSDPLPSGVTDMGTTSSDNITFTSTLQFSRLNQSLHAGMYTCRLGPARLMESITITVNPPPILAVVTTNLNNPVMVGQTDNTLTCDISGADGLTDRTITYQWTRDGQEIPDRNSRTLNFNSPLQLSLAGQSVYACSATVSSSLLNGNIQASASTTQTVTIQIPDPQSVTLTASPDNILNGTLVTVNCSVVLNSIREEDLSLLNVSAEISRNGTILTQTSQSVDGTTFNIGATVNSFCQSDVGSYICIATVRPAPSSRFLTGTGQGTSPLMRLTIGTPPTPSRENTLPRSCGGDIAIAVVVYTLIECLLAAPVITAVLVICWKRNQRKPSQYKSTSDATATQSREVHPGEDVYEDPDRTAVTTTPREFKLTECPAYVTTTASSPQTTTEAQRYYEL